MATIPPDTRVVVEPRYQASLAFPPPSTGDLAIAVHSGALRAASSFLTQVVGLSSAQVAWTGAIDEAMLSALPAVIPNARQTLWNRLVRGSRLWHVIRPGLLTNPSASRPLLTVYDGDRPWVVVGELVGGDLIAAPLNDAAGNPKWWTPVLAANDLVFPGSKASQVELAHLWSLPSSVVSVGFVTGTGGSSIEAAIRAYQ